MPVPIVQQPTPLPPSLPPSPPPIPLLSLSLFEALWDDDDTRRNRFPPRGKQGTIFRGSRTGGVSASPGEADMQQL
ncbi:hypothetical protein INR49_030394 [Caranx melampygus]|nr:hypothetical protein INR49_030394 [Caranx melampygus]